MTLDQYFDYMGLRFNAPNAEQAQLPSTTINWIVGMVSGGTTTTSYSGAIQVLLDRHELDNLAISATPSQDFLNAVAEKKITVTPASAAQQVANIFAMLDIFPANFNIVTPRQVQDLP